MKKLAFILLAMVCGGFTILAQSPGLFNYQAVVRNSNGDLMINSDINFRISIREGSSDGTTVFSETHLVQSNSYGVCNLKIGDGNNITGSLSTIDWSSGTYFLQIETDVSGGESFTETGTVQLLSVPYAMYANAVSNTDDADADPTNELQDLTFSGDTLSLENGNHIIFPYDSSHWAVNGQSIYYNTGNVGIGSSTPRSKLEVKADASFTVDDTLFSVKDKDGNIVFAVFPDGAKVYVNEGVKGRVGGFAVTGRNPTKAPLAEEEYLRVTPDSTRIWVTEDPTKARVGGFAVTGRNPTKGMSGDYLVVTSDSTRIYINDTTTAKRRVGGFAVTGRNPTKGPNDDYLRVTRDSTRVYITESTTKARVGGFAVTGRNPTKGVDYEFLKVTSDSTRIFTKDTVSGFGIGNLNTGAAESYLKLNPNNYLIGHNSGNNLTKGKYNSFMGYEAGYTTDIGSNNIFMGYKSGYTNDEGDGNLFIGNESGYSNMYGSSNVFLGYQAGYGNTEGDYNTYIGYKSAYTSSKGSYNTFIGYQSGTLNIGQNNVFIGYMSGGNSPAGESNVFIGKNSGLNNKGQSNVFIGNETGINNEFGFSNIFIGNSSGNSNVSGDYNVFLGRDAGRDNQDGSLNVFLGNMSGQSNISGTENVYLGDESGRFATGGRNIFLGCRTGSGSGVVGDDNIFLGYTTGTNATGSNNIYLGTDVGVKSTGSNNVFIGSSLGYLSTESNRLILTDLIKGEIDNDLLYLNAHVNIMQGITIWNTARTDEGTVRYTGTDFEGRKGSNWVSLTSGGYYMQAPDLNPWYAVYVDADGKVGVGLTNPSDWLHIWSNSSTYKGIKVSNPYPHLVLDDQTSSADDYELMADGNTFYIRHDAGDDGIFENSRFTINSSGNVGIKKTSGGATLDVGGTLQTSGNVGINTSPGSYALAVSGTTYLSGVTGINTAPNSAFGLKVTGGSVYALSVTGYTALENVGINTSPVSSYALNVSGNSALFGNVGIKDVASVSYGLQLGTGTTHALYAKGNIHATGRITTTNKVGIGDITPSYMLSIYDNSTEVYAAEIFKDYNSNAYAGLLIRAGRDDGDGTNILIGCFNGAGTYKGGLAIVNNGNVQLVTSSDRRLKDKIVDTKLNALKIATDLRVVDFEYKDSPGIERLGFIAQEVEKVYPRMVSYNDSEDIFEISQMELIPVLTKAIQEQDEKITKLEKENKNLKSENEEIKARLTEIEKLVKTK